MVLRLILVGLVASMGFEAPTSQDVETWNRTGRAWVAARMDDLSSMAAWSAPAEAGDFPSGLVEAEEAPGRAEVAAVAAGPAVDDLAFEVVVEGMASRFGDEIAMDRAGAPALAAVAVAPVEAEALPVIAEAPAAVAEVVAIPEPASPAAEPAPEPEATREARLSRAVRLTRNAFEAWASLLVVSDGTRSGEDVVLTR